MSDWEKRLILKVYAGSISYGTNTKDSDEDFRGICIPDKNILLGLHTFETKEKRELGELDDVTYSLQKFVQLALQNNPNILDTLFVANNHVVFINEFGKELREIRKEFISKQAYKTYGGYAISQLQRMTKVEKNATGKRAALIEKYGYDTKNAMHLIRLLHMGIEILTEGEVHVLRHDNKYLMEIRNGKYTLSDIEDEYKHLKQLLDLAYVNSKIPSQPNFDKINSWLVDAHIRSLKWEGNK
ncbi:hypothetical protein EEL30_21790 [Brevibacillus laterosporus]|uniref:Nucleotidyltransferase n=1 Tax=Brevibacillus laterosporus TaxID=1465 RepID=A0A518VCF1_BRELA|nr:hypothetical protein EEL30_21790 [Brevibacillus laterosporus]